MSFDPLKYDIEIWLRDEANNLLQKRCYIYDNEGRIVDLYETRVHIVPVGYYNYKGVLSQSAPCLHRSYYYSADGNRFEKVPEMAEWTAYCESNAVGGGIDTIGLPTTNGIPLGHVVTYSTPYFGEKQIAVNTSDVVISKTIQTGQTGYIRQVLYSSDSLGEFTMELNGVIIAKGRLSYTEYNGELLFGTADGGIKVVENDLIEIKALNCGESLGLFNSTLMVVYE